MRRVHSLALAVLLLAGCPHNTTYDADAAQRLQRVAIVVRVLGSPSADLPDTVRGTASPEKLSKKLEGAMSAFEVAERVRSGLIEHLPDAPPWNTVVPAVQADSVLGDTLTVDRPASSPQFDDLQRIGVDGVLYIEIEHWGVRADDTSSGYMLQGTGRFFTLPGHDTLWRGTFDTLGDGPLTTGWSQVGAIREHLMNACRTAGEQLALTLGGSSSSVAHTPALEQPDIEDKGHPPEKLKPVIPFNIPERDGGAPRDAGGGIDISFPDGGDIPGLIGH
ncbi:MAG: hypothetical protein JST54_03900 [Deltaproteobacteria bacterium]|nr:hypothetical protein [Deltaproteobacteria bacterium]